MGWVSMSERELQRVEVLGEIVNGQRSVASASSCLGLSERQVWRLLARYKSGGGGALAHRGRGRPSNRRLDSELRERALELVRTHYRDFGPTLAAEMLADRHGLTVSRETLRQWMAETGLWLSRRQRRQFHPPRLRRERLGELVQIDGSEHRWFEERGDPCTLLVFIDDATGRLMQLRFVASESAFSYFAALEGYLAAHGRPLAFYSDKHSVFRVSQSEAKGGQGMTQFGRALAELTIEILCANSSQAKGRVERVNRTLQDRLVKELRLAGITGIEAGNAFLPGFIERFNARFAVPPARPDDGHRPLTVTPDRLREILCWREQRHVGQQLTLSYERKRIMLDVTDLTEGLVGQYVDTYAFADGRLELRWKGAALSYQAFDKDQRVLHADIVENKRLSAVLAQVKEIQDSQSPPRVKSNSEKLGYRKTGAGKRGRKSFVDKHIEAKAVE
ncbi:transposase [Azospirillum thiophilum]|uniref:Transposase n=1 Tax=Azospirillum thiophilum TaxID=528244 RepID=A0A0F2KME2_9PROT|nr:transposase [Azospirillum thiophilum]ALG75028.1 transposase [Azospirillum thiophilum]KJR62417.1 transposase [Azospirillum thiophilum]KJR63895.1 transposase [Azospirillum thiophilum]